MSTANLKNLQQWAGQNGWAVQGLAAPILVVAILALMVLPIAPWMLDTFFTLNIALALMVMMVAAYMVKPLDFAAFPSVLLLTTLMRLSLNVASTRVVLLEGHTGPGAAGAVIEAFGHFLIGGNFAVGLIVFSILVVINFIVITKGAGRIAEVSARFILDAMPGKQMAIDADLNAGILTREEAKARREEVREEADFYGAMDGANKFIRGDAIAGILILFINLVGGFAVGMAQHIPVMVAAILLTVAVMLFAANPMGRFIDANPTIKMLALAFIVAVGAYLLLDGFELHIPKGYLYGAMGFSAVVECLNLWAKKRASLRMLRE